MGKRQLGELQPSELVVTILVSNIATLSIEDTNIPLLGSVLPIFMLVSCEVIISVISLKSSRFRRLVSGNPRILIRDGILDQTEMKNLRWSLDDLMEQLRMNGCFDIREVNFAVVETSGMLSVHKKRDGAQGRDPAPPMNIICDGETDRHALEFLGLDPNWLNAVLREEGVKDSDIFLMICDRGGGYSIIKREKQQ
jgi:uncharacterized membrane protein YcaP (DUF421 family)